jgi:DNA-binding NtrC family response regulator
MREQITALLIYHQPEPLGGLKLALDEQSIQTCRVRTCGEALHLLKSTAPPHLVFTDTILPDGTWRDVLAGEQRATIPVNVIVVARLADVKLYVEVIEQGAFDFIAPPFVAADLAHVVSCAAHNALRRRKAQAGVIEPSSRLLVSRSPQPV